MQELDQESISSMKEEIPETQPQFKKRKTVIVRPSKRSSVVVPSAQDEIIIHTPKKESSKNNGFISL